MRLQEFWAKQGCVIWQPHHTEVGAGTFNPATFLKVLGPDPWRVAYVEPSIRPTDGRYGENPYRLGHYYQYQVVIKPCPHDIQDIYLASLEHLGIDLAKHDVRFVEDDWESPTLGAWGLGWEVWIDGMECTQFTYFQQVGGIDLDPPSVELTYGTERLAMYLQGANNVFDLVWVPGLTYGDLYRKNEAQWSVYNFELADISLLQRLFADYERECERCLERGLTRPAYDFVLKTSHVFNQLDARGAISVTERTGYIARVRNLARKVAESYVAELESATSEGGALCVVGEAAAVAPGWSSFASREARDFLFEIGVEELPASACRAAIDLLPERVAGLFAEAGVEVNADQVKVMVSPRRIAIYVPNVAGEQASREIAQRGPAYETAFAPDGTPTKAAEGFARAKGVSVSELEIREENGRRFLYYVVRSQGQPTGQLLPDICLRIVRDMHFPKNMRWGVRDVRFSRPIRWLVVLWGDEVVPLVYAGLSAGRVSRGHRWLGGPVKIDRPGEYKEALRSAGVVVDHEERRKLIKAALEQTAAEYGLRVIDPTGKLEEVVFLVEWPTVGVGEFSARHLLLPPEVLETAMQSHQRYFPLVDEQGRLANKFLFVSNGNPEYLEEITRGNERVLEGRIEDAEFSFEKDKAVGLTQMASQLDKIVFHVKVGTMKDKTDRLVALVQYLAEVLELPEEVRQRGLEAARLAKADQVSVMVREFPDLEGVMGETYALMEGRHPEVARAIREQYLPDAAGGPAPDTLPGALLATAEKVDNITAAFACGEPPSGSKDPYGLRRAAAGMVVIAFKHGLRYQVDDLVRRAYQELNRFPDLLAEEIVVGQATAFILERLSRQLTDEGFSRDVVEAVLPTSREFLDLKDRATALQEFRSGPRWEDLVTAFTRPANLARQLSPEAAAEAASTPGWGILPTLFEAEAEEALYVAWQQARRRVEEAMSQRNYQEALAALADLRPAVDRYFDQVLVMVEQDDIRLNRLRQLAAIAGTVRQVAHLEVIQG